MMQIIQMTDEEKFDMYMKLSKKELSKMLIEANRTIDMFTTPVYPVYPVFPVYPTEPYPTSPFYTIEYTTTGDSTVVN